MDARHMLGEIIHKHRTQIDVPQDQYGAKYGVSGPGIFKYEKGYIRPSLKVWMPMAADAGVPERRAVLVWLKWGLPEKYQEYVELQAAVAKLKPPQKGRGLLPAQDAGGNPERRRGGQRRVSPRAGRVPPGQRTLRALQADGRGGQHAARHVRPPWQRREGRLSSGPAADSGVRRGVRQPQGFQRGRERL